MIVEQMVEVFEGLVKTIKKQVCNDHMYMACCTACTHCMCMAYCAICTCTWHVHGIYFVQIEEVQPSDCNLNIYQPSYGILASCLLRLGHTHILMAGTESHAFLKKGQECFKEGLDVLHRSAHVDPCLSAELLYANGKLLLLELSGKLTIICCCCCCCRLGNDHTATGFQNR